MKYGRHFLLIGGIGLGVLLMPAPVRTQNGYPVSKILVLPESLQSMSLKEFLAKNEKPVGLREEWRPLSENESLERNTELTSKILEYSAELADSLRAPYVSQGLLRTKEAFSSYHDLAKRHHLRFNLSYDQAALQYNFDY